MNFCEYANNILSLHLFSNSVNKINVEFIKKQAMRVNTIISVYQGFLNTDTDFTLKVLKPRTSPLNKTTISYVEYANKFITKYGVVPMGLIIFSNRFLLREIIMDNNPYEVILKIR